MTGGFCAAPLSARLFFSIRPELRGRLDQRDPPDKRGPLDPRA
jgi:hypothetical protein